MITPYVHKVKYYECDRMGVTHHSNYLRIMEEARVDYLDKVGYGFEKMEEEGIVSPVVEIKINYKKTTTFQDEISVELLPFEISSLKIGFRYIMSSGGVIVCTAESVHCFLKDGHPIALADKYPGLSVAFSSTESTISA